MSLVLNYTQAKKVFEKAKADQFAMPAVNVTTSKTINATFEAAKNVNCPIIIQFSNSGDHFSLENRTPRTRSRHQIPALSAVERCSRSE